VAAILPVVQLTVELYRRLRLYCRDERPEMTKALFAFALLGVAFTSAPLAAQAAAREVNRDAIIDALNKTPLSMYIAHGPEGSCGQGCDTWIQVEGGFDAGSGERFRAFLNRAGKRKLPVYFHSTGGLIDQAQIIGNLMRQHQLAAGVGVGIPRACDEKKLNTVECIKLRFSGKEIAVSELHEAGASCASACIYALIGASKRTIGPSAILAVHTPASFMPSPTGSYSPVSIALRQQLNGHIRDYVTKMGIAKELSDITATVPYEKLRILTRDEIARLKIDTRDFAETRWTVIHQTSGNVVAAKAVEQAIEKSKYVDRQFAFACTAKKDAMWVGVSRPKPANDPDAFASFGLRIGEVSIWFTPLRARTAGQPLPTGEVETREVRETTVEKRAIRDAIAAKSIKVVENASPSIREYQLSTDNLEEAIEAVIASCITR
jgi:hypothetical protein